MSVHAAARAQAGSAPGGAPIAEWLPALAGLALLYLPTYWDLAHETWGGEEQAHGPIVLGIALWLFWRARHAVSAAPIDPRPLAGWTLVGLGLLAYVLGRSQDVALIETGSQIPVLAGVLLVQRGWRALRCVWFPLLFLAFMIPLPGILVTAMTGPLKQAVSAVAESLLYAAGYPVARSGVVINIGQYQLLVDDACSGLNSMISLSAMGLFYLYLVAPRGGLALGVLLASLLPIAFFANVVRVVVLVLVTYHFGDEAGRGFIHGFAGILLFAVALIVLIAFEWMLNALRRAFSGAARPA